MATIPIHSPTIPFLGLIPGGLSPGRMLRIKGMLHQHGERCQIYIQSGAAVAPRDDVILHISIRPNEHAIVRNTLQNQVIGPEERFGGNPIRYGEPFDMLVLAEAGHFKIAINGTHFCTFSYRLPIHNARFISITGGVVIYSILVEHDQPSAQPYLPSHAPPPSYPHSVGFVPNPPPMNLPPPPPYTPVATYPIGGGGGHYKDLYPSPPPPPPPPMTGSYPHHRPQPYQPAVPFSPHLQTSSSQEGKRDKVKMVKNSLVSGLQQTQDLLRGAMGNKPVHPIPPVPLNGWAIPSSNPVHHPPGGETSWGHPSQRQQQQKASWGGSALPAGMAGLVAGSTTAAIASQFLPKGKNKKLLKYGAAAGAAALGGYALAKGVRHRKGRSSSGSSSSSSSSSSDSD